MLYLIGVLGITGLVMSLTFPQDTSHENDEKPSTDGSDVGDQESNEPQRVDEETTLNESVIELAASFFSQEDTESPSMSGGPGDDLLLGTTEADFIMGREGNDELLGQGGDDTLAGGRGNDIVVSEHGVDSLFGDKGNDALHARSGNDFLHGGDGNDSLFGGAGNDTLYGGSIESDILIGGDGDDSLMVGVNDRAHGGAGSDTFFILDQDEFSEPPELIDFDAQNDSIVIVLQDGQADLPVTLTVSENDPDQTELRLGNKVIATMANEGAPETDDVRFLLPTAELVSFLR